jgi:steroid 5-alpha reductase family enzyme
MQPLVPASAGLVVITAHLIVLGLIIAGVVMLSLWLVHHLTRNASWVDVGWAGTLGLLAIAYAIAAPGYLPRRILVGCVVGLWSARLTLHLLTRVLAEPEDPRYVEMRARWGSNLGLKFFVLFVGQGFLDVLLALPFLFAAADVAESIHVLTWAGAALALVGMLGEGTADAQLRGFKRNPANKGQVCRVGLWGWSRHPNYFFDWLVWCGFALIGLGSPWGWTGLLGPALMLYFLTRVTGIALTEAHALQSRGDAYRQYQREVSAFVPLPPRRVG